MKRDWFILQALFACLIFLSISQSAFGVCTPQSAVIWVNGDDNSSVWVNGNYLGGVNYVNWDSPSDPVSLNVPIAYLNATGDNVIAIAVTDTAGGQIWGSFALDVTCVGGMHSYVSSNDGGIKLSATNAYNTPPAANWYDLAYADGAWGNAVAMSVTTWAKPLYDPSDGKVVVPYSYDGVGSSGANEWDPSGMNMLYMRKHFTLTPVTPLPSATITIMKSASMTSQIPGGPVNFTITICNTGGYTRKPILISDYWVSPAACTWSMGGPYYWDDLNLGKLYRDAGTPDRFTLYYPLGMEAGVCKTFTYEMNPCWFSTEWESTAWCTTATNYSSVTWTAGSATTDIPFTLFCPSKTNTPSRTRTPTVTFTHTRTMTIAMTATFTRTGTPTFTRTISPTYTSTQTPVMSFTFTRTPSPTHTRTVTPTYTRTMTHSPSRTMTGTFTRSPTPAITFTFTTTPSPTQTRTVTPTHTGTTSPTYSRTVTATQVITSTFTRTASSTHTRTATGTYTSTMIPTMTFTGTRTYTATFTRTATPTYTATPSITITSMNTPTVTPTISPTFTRTGTPTHTRTATPSPTSTYTCTRTPSYTVTASITITSMNTPTVTLTISPTFTRTGTPTHTRSATPSPTSTYTRTVTPTYTVTPSITITSMNTPTVTPTMTPTFTRTGTPSVSPSATYTNTQTPSFTYTVTRTPTPSFSVTPSITITSMNTPTVTPTITLTYTATPTFSSTLTLTLTSTCTYTATQTVTITSLDTATVTPTVTPTFTVTLTPTPTLTCTFTLTFTSTYTVTETATHTSVNTATHTPSSTATFTATLTSTPTFTITATPSFTRTLTLTPTRTYTPTFTRTETVTYSPTPAGTPALLTISMSVAGDNPQLGSEIVYWIMLENKDTQPASNIRVWDSLPPEVEFLGMNSTQVPVITGNVLTWDFPPGFVLAPGEAAYVQFTVRIISLPGLGVIDNRASVDYNDPFYATAVNRHPVLTCSDIQFPREMPVAYPNPFRWVDAVNNELKFANVPPGSTIQIYTLSGERVISIEVKFVRAVWNGRNSAGIMVSPGIYYYVVRNMFSAEAVAGKIFIVK